MTSRCDVGQHELRLLKSSTPLFLPHRILGGRKREGAKGGIAFWKESYPWAQGRKTETLKRRREEIWVEMTRAADYVARRPSHFGGLNSHWIARHRRGLVHFFILDEPNCSYNCVIEIVFSWRGKKEFFPYSQCCQLRDFVARFSDFLDPFSAFFFLKRLATNLATFGQTLATFQMSPVLSCKHEILSYTSPCVCSDQWALAPAERSSTFQWPHGSWHRCEWAVHVHTVLPRTNHLPASPLFEIKQ